MIENDHHLSAGRVAGYVANALTPTERDEVVRHLDHCAACRAEVMDVGEIAADVRARPAVRSKRRLLPVAVALAAGLAALTVYQVRQQDELPVVRAKPTADEGIPLIAAVAPPDGGNVGDSVVLRWRSTDQGSYDVFVLTEDGRPLWHLSTSDTAVLVPRSILDAGATYFWRVDAIGNGIVATTGVRRLVVDR
jgi:hypothetical protein